MSILNHGIGGNPVLVCSGTAIRSWVLNLGVAGEAMVEVSLIASVGNSGGRGSRLLLIVDYLGCQSRVL